MYADVELISNNTYKFKLFTYSIPSKFINKIQVGSIVEVNFRNKIYKAIVLEIKKNTSIYKLNEIVNLTNITINQKKLEYLKFLALSNYLNIGIVIHNLINIETFNKQNILNTKNVKNLHLSQLNEINFKFQKNIIFAASLKEISNIYRTLNNKISISFYQKTGGKEEIEKFFLIKDYKLVILLSNNFEKININNDTGYFFYDSNSTAYRLPKLNQLNIIESAYLKNSIFGGNFYFLNEFQNLEFDNTKPKLKNEFDYEIKYFISSTIKDSFHLLFNKFKSLNYYSNEEFDHPNTYNKFTDISKKEIEALILVNPKIARNNLLDSSRLIYLIRLLNYFTLNKLYIFVISNKEININKSLNSSNFQKWIDKEIDTRKKYGPNLLLKIFSIKSNEQIQNNLDGKLFGPISDNGEYFYELHLKLNKVKYLETIDIFSKLTDYEIKRVKHLWVK